IGVERVHRQCAKSAKVSGLMASFCHLVTLLPCHLFGEYRIRITRWRVWPVSVDELTWAGRPSVIVDPVDRPLISARLKNPSRACQSRAGVGNFESVRAHVTRPSAASCLLAWPGGWAGIRW